MPIMNPALAKLIHLSARSSRRRFKRFSRTPRGALLIGFGILVIALVVGPSLVLPAFLPGKNGLSLFADTIESFLPFGLMMMALVFTFTAAGERAFMFTPAEVDFLFPAPFHRHELLAYEIGRSLIGIATWSLFMSSAMLIYLRSWFAGWVGLMLIALFFQLLGLAASLVGQIVLESSRTRTRRFLLSAIGLLLILGATQAYARVGFTPNLQLVNALRQSWGGRIALAPFEPFARAIMAAKVFPTLVGWGLVAAAIDLALLLLVFKLDANYLESAAATTQRFLELRQRVRKAGGVAVAAPKSSARLRLPRPGWLRGVGPIGWRQALLAMRTSHHVVILTTLVLVGSVIVLRFVVPNGADGPALYAAWIGIGLLTYLTFLFSLQVSWAFRGDLDHMDCLKSLPIRSPAIAAGEIGGAVLVLLMIQLPLLAFLAAASGRSPTPVLAAATFAGPFDLLLLGSGNLLFLVYPTRMGGTTSADFQHVTRNLLFMLLQFLILIPVFGIPALFGLIAWFLTNGLWPALAAAWLVMAIEAPILLALIAWAYDRFDVSAHMPA